MNNTTSSHCPGKVAIRERLCLQAVVSRSNSVVLYCIALHWNYLEYVVYLLMCHLDKEMGDGGGSRITSLSLYKDNLRTIENNKLGSVSQVSRVRLRLVYLTPCSNRYLTLSIIPSITPYAKVLG